MAERLWVKATNSAGHSLIWMEPQLHDAARETVIGGMTNMALSYLYNCGSDAEELEQLAECLWTILAGWWDAHNRLVAREAPVPDGYDRFRVFWRPFTIAADEVREERSGEDYPF